MENKIGPMITARIQPVQIIIQHQGKPGQGVPETSLRGSQCPDDIGRGEAGLDMAVPQHIGVIVVMDKIESPYLIENQEGGKDKQERK